MRFDDFEFDPGTLELRRAGVPIKLQQQPARVLAVLIDNAGQLVKREALRRAIWGDQTFVDFDRGLNYCVSQIRTALGDPAEAPRYLETLRGRGYRFIGATEARLPVRSPSATPRRSLVAVAAVVVSLVSLWGGWHLLASRRTLDAIGVAPLVAPAGEQPWAEALQAQIVSRLSIASRTPIIELTNESAADARTRWRLEGRVDRSEDQYRVTMLLRDTRDGTVPWSDIFAGTPGDWVDAQSEMAQRITEIIRYRIEGPSAGLPKRRHRLPDRVSREGSSGA